MTYEPRKFACTHCGQHVEAEVSFAGQTVACPCCQQPMRIPAEAAFRRQPAGTGSSPHRGWQWVLAIIVATLGVGMATPVRQMKKSTIVEIDYGSISQRVTGRYSSPTGQLGLRFIDGTVFPSSLTAKPKMTLNSMGVANAEFTYVAPHWGWIMAAWGVLFVLVTALVGSGRR